MCVYVYTGIDIRLGREGRDEGVGFDGTGNSLQKGLGLTRGICIYTYLLE